MSSRADRSLYVFILTAYLITWLCWIAAIVLGYEDISFMQVVNRDFTSNREVFTFILFRLGVYGPLLAAAGTSAYFFKSRGLSNIWKRMIKWRLNREWYLYLLLLPIFINLAVVLAGLIIGLEFSAFFSSNIPLLYLFLFFIYQVFTSGMEEPGWRGFALERMLERYTAEKASWLLGLVWAVWHFPYLFYLYEGRGIFVLIPSLLGFTMAIIGQTFIITWFYVNTRSLFLAIILHAWLNTAAIIILGDITIINPSMGIFPALFTWLVVVFLLKKYGNSLTKKKAKIPV